MPATTLAATKRASQLTAAFLRQVYNPRSVTTLGDAQEQLSFLIDELTALAERYGEDCPLTDFMGQIGWPDQS